MATGLTVGLLSVTALGVVAVSQNSGPRSGVVRVNSVSAMQNMDHAAAGDHHRPAVVDYDAVGGSSPAPTVGATVAPLAILGNTCDNSALPAHDGFQAGNKCVTTEFGEVGETAKNPTLIISSAPRQVKVGQPFRIQVSTRNLVRDRFLAAAQGGYYKESSFLNSESLQRGHFHTACRMLSSKTLAPDPSPGSVFFKATEDGGGTAAPDIVTVELPTGLPTRGLAECAAWAGDGSHRIPMMESVQAIPAFDTVRIWVR